MRTPNMIRAAAAAVLSLAAFAGPARAVKARPDGTLPPAVVQPGETVAGETFLFGQEVRMEGTAERDLWMLAQGTLDFGGTARQDVRLAATGANFTNGVVQGNLAVFGQGIWLRPPFALEGNAWLVAGTEIHAEPASARDASLTARKVTLGGVWNGNVEVTADELRLLPNTRVSGTLTADVATPFVVGDGIEIGELKRVDHAPKDQSLAGLVRDRLLHGVGVFLSFYILGWIAQFFAPVRLRMAANNVLAMPFRSFLVGIAAAMAGLLLTLPLVATGFGLPAGLFLAMELVLMGMTAPVVTGLWIGALLLRFRGRASGRYAGILATGLGTLALLTAVLGPWGDLLLFAFLPLGFGALVLTLFQRTVFVAAHMPPPMPPVQPPSPPPPPPPGNE